ncbi:hypothetical protein [Actinokineospora sp. UTMC 2448]|uniref:hypothetical protein n=1 Tax=Actinokineospora sp. UTMC 2448 TaxID=2268449 RepID=UPI002164390A|nr:hypothetical protein [Actinokineospora sp. UTMC 2448]
MSSVSVVDEEDTMDDAITVTRVGTAVVVGGAGDTVELAERLVGEAGRTPVVVGASAMAALTRLDPWVVADLAEVVGGERGIRVFAPYWGAVGADGAPPPARLLADRLGVEVVAPEGELVALEGGAVFVSGRGLGWAAYAPGRPRVRTGPRYPEPWWQRYLPEDLGEHVTQTPSGLWIHGSRAGEWPRMAGGERMVVVAEASASVVEAVLRALPDEVRDHVTVEYADVGNPPRGRVVVTADGRVLPANPLVGTASAMPSRRARPQASVPSTTVTAVAPSVAARTRRLAPVASMQAAAQTGPPPAAPASSSPAVSLAPALLTPVSAVAPPAARAAVQVTAAMTAVPAPSRALPAAATRAAVEVPIDAHSTPEQRQRVRAALGSRYDIAVRTVTRLLSERPGLRAGGDDPALLAELAVVHVFADDPQAFYDADFHSCLAGGLRRLPTLRGVVVRGIPEESNAQTGAVLRLPTPVVALPARVTRPVGPAEALIWTTTARRLDDLGDGDAVLPAHTRLRVLAVEHSRLLLAEDGAPTDTALTRLRAAAATRPPTTTPTPTRWFGALPAA